ncbi:MAG: peptidylprolyl isomerase [Gemmataceae bacterium]|nr:peptidylprolyl isomerase [Gemmataceae bacterium]MDW8266516.1 peptidylprolyl isomerase [Gemmataceae bacterium]
MTREVLGEYLIARYGAAKLPLLVNHRIIDLACQQAGIEVTNAEIEAALAEDLGRLSVNQKDFVEKILRQYNKTLFEWKEDVIRPRLQLGKLCRQQVRVEEEDLKKAFEAHYGEKVECRIIMWPRHEEKIALKEYEALRDSEEAFEHKATHQASGQLSATGGRIAPFGRHTTGNEELEKEAFRLQPGELSRLIGTPEGFVVLKLVRRIPADDKVKLADVRSKLEAEIIEKKVQMKIRDVFNELSAKANPKLFLKDHDKESDIIREVQTELQSNPPRPEGK